MTKKLLIITDLGEAGQAPWRRHICSIRRCRISLKWIPAFAGMTKKLDYRVSKS
ncbi:Uncharacterized protein dnm_062380 [Desulfonema magnum]|uniref:Uncharacterized protein n=1 Tax=Desulfonema magnum TaxID=45655 RepID=A0A975GQS8_9BACT|nr:Uncharacterized protein dnm_062380 [Desulfonema magnum]